MAAFPISNAAAEAILLGLAAGPVCLASCGPVVLPWMLVQPRGVRVHAWQLSLLLAARLAGYLLFACVLWSAGLVVSRTWSGRIWMLGGVQVALACGLLAYAAAWPHAGCKFRHSKRAELIQIGETPSNGLKPRWTGAALLGFLTGINLCPPFLMAGVRAMQLPTLGGVLLFFALFFAGTAIWFVPFLSLGVIQRTPVFLTVARTAAVLLACWYGFSGASLLIEKAIYG